LSGFTNDFLTRKPFVGLNFVSVHTAFYLFIPIKILGSNFPGMAFGAARVFIILKDLLAWW
jgi:hypothetical protein